MGGQINIRYPIVPVIGGRINVGPLAGYDLEVYFKSTNVSTYIVISIVLMIEDPEGSDILLFVKPLGKLH